MVEEMHEEEFIEWIHQDEDLLNEEPYSEWIKRLRQELAPKRFQHTLGVARSAIALAKRHKINMHQAISLGLLHDCAKGNEAELIEKYQWQDLIEESQERPKALIHSDLGVLYARQAYGIDDPEILESIYYHTTGRAPMTELDLLIYVADGIEPARSYMPLEKVRYWAKVDLKRACVLLLDNSLRHLLDSQAIIALDSIRARNYLLEEIDKEERNAI